MSVSCICTCLTLEKRFPRHWYLAQANHFSIARSSFFHQRVSLQWMQKGCTYSWTYSQGWLQELSVSRKWSNWYYMFREFWYHGVPVSGQGLNVHAKCVSPPFCLFEIYWIHNHLRSLKRRVLRTPPHLCPYIHECPKSAVCLFFSFGCCCWCLCFRRSILSWIEFDDPQSADIRSFCNFDQSKICIRIVVTTYIDSRFNFLGLHSWTWMWVSMCAE